MHKVWEEIKSAEEQAEAIVAAAREEAKSLLAKAEAEAKALLANGAEQAKDRGEQLVTVRRQAAEQAAKEQAGRAHDEIARLIGAARAMVPAAVELVRERMTR